MLRDSGKEKSSARNPAAENKEKREGEAG